MDGSQAAELVLRFCGSRRFAKEVVARRPYADRAVLFATADLIWEKLGASDWMEAFSHHPKIGQAQGVRAHEAREQSGVRGASPEVLRALEEGNRAYQARFGYLFLICAAGKSAQEMLSTLQERLTQDPERELLTAMREQGKITRLRIESWMEGWLNT